jgi:hypothetical protein
MTKLETTMSLPPSRLPLNAALWAGLFCLAPRRGGQPRR